MLSIRKADYRYAKLKLEGKLTTGHILEKTFPSEEIAHVNETGVVGRFFRFMQEHVIPLHGQCIISGSYSLMLYISSIRQGLQETRTCFVPDDIDFYISSVAPNVVEALIEIFIRQNEDISMARDYLNSAILYRDRPIEQIMNYVTKQKSIIKSQKIQIMIWQDQACRFLDSAIELASCVTLRYDISVVKTALVDANDMAQFYVANDEVKSDIVRNEFSYMIREDCEDNYFMKYRIQKYKERGYILYKITYENSDVEYSGAEIIEFSEI
jgi:hypothetical protein